MLLHELDLCCTCQTDTMHELDVCYYMSQTYAITLGYYVGYTYAMHGYAVRVALQQAQAKAAVEACVRTEP